MEKFRFLEHTADAMFEAFGSSLNELFENAALAVEEIQVNTKTVQPTETRIITLKSDTIEMLLFDFLQEIIYLKDAEEILFSQFKVEIEQNKHCSLIAKCSGEKINPQKHELNVDAKAVTMHQFEVKKENNIWKAHVIIDI